MRTSDIYLILTEKLEKIRDVIDEYSSEIEHYKSQISKKGTTINLRIEEDKKFVFNQNHLVQLGTLFTNDIINEVELNFIVDCILFSIYDFENDLILEELENLTDPEVNGSVTKEYMQNLISSIRG